ncbi:hypothetical protein F4779DRAFT_599555 [Xylariaceae sp. FL0662B]|nr:hypothetical protein F4779DRAFT_599555 [Xylariaceae sp. FL0662B]
MHINRVPFHPIRLGWLDVPLGDMEKVEYEFTKHEEEWRAGYMCTVIEDLLRKAPVSRNINKIMCFGLGTLDGERRRNTVEGTGNPEADAARARVQHAAALTIRRVLREKTGNNKIQLKTQDPGYSRASKMVLEKFEFQIVPGRGGHGFTEVDENTVVFTIDAEVPVKELVAEKKKPAMMIWRSVTQEDITYPKIPKSMGDGDTPRTQRLVKDYDEIKIDERVLLDDEVNKKRDKDKESNKPREDEKTPERERKEEITRFDDRVSFMDKLSIYVKKEGK